MCSSVNHLLKIKSIECMNIVNNKLFSRKRIEMGINLLQKTIIPTLTFGAETWNKLTVNEKVEINISTNQLLNAIIKYPKYNS